MSRYLAFISYRHQPESLDASLQFRKGLEGYHLPADCPVPKHRKVFRDTDELPTSSDLGMDIENALRDSDCLITLCTEEYVCSKWCMREVEIYLELGRRDRILPVLVSGTPETSVPEVLRGIPLAADLRGDGPAGTYDRKRAKAAIPQMLSLISGMEADRIARAEFRFRAGAAAAAAAVFTAGMLGFAGYATYTAKRIADNNVQIAAAAEETKKEERQALAERDTALLRQAEYLSGQAMQALIDEDPDTAIELALSALPEDLHGDLPVSPEAEGTLRLAMSMETDLSYRFLKAVETDFNITGYYLNNRLPDRIFLTEECFETAAHYVDYAGSAGVAETVFAESRQNALDQGYTKLWYLPGDVNSSRHFYYGGGNQLYSEGDYKGYYSTNYTLKGEPFCPEYVSGNISKEIYEFFIAWEETGDGSIPRMAMFKNGTAEALAEFELTGTPVSVSSASNGSWTLVADNEGTVSFYDFDGVCRKTIEGDYTEAYYYYNSGPCACLGSGDGTVTILDLESFKEILKFRCPSPVRQINVNRKKNYMMVRCDSGVYLHRFKDGSLIAEIGDHAAPNLVIWKDDDGGAGSDPSILLLLYDRKVEIYTMDTEIDSSVSEYHPLFHVGVPPGHSMFYSQDGQRIYQQSFMGNFKYVPAEEMLYCWDAHTGYLLWEIARPRYASRFSLSTDGRTLWRIYDGIDGTDVERFDGVTGEELLSTHWNDEFWDFQNGCPVESMDGTRAFILTYYNDNSELFALIDPRTGELLHRMDLGKESADWSERHVSGAGAGDFETTSFAAGTGRILPRERTGLAEAMFSADGSCLYLIQNATRKETGISGVCIDRLDAGNGEILEEEFLETGEQEIKLWKEEEAVVLIDKQLDEKNDFHSRVNVDGVWIYPSAVAAWKGCTVTHTVRIIDLSGKSAAIEVPFSYQKSPEILNTGLKAVQPFDGGMALYWDGENADVDGEPFCCRLNRDGSVGDIHAADSEEGRRLWVPKDNYLVFNGQEAFFSSAGIKRISDGVLLLGNMQSSSVERIKKNADTPDFLAKDPNYGITAAKDGRSICMYDPKNTSSYPILILPSDLDTLVEKGKRRLKGS